MPKTYSDDERAYIEKRLKEEASYCMRNFGIRRTTIDELVERVKIPKGTFYLFYKTKEQLLFQVLLEEHEKIQAELLDEVKELHENITVDNLTDTIFNFYKAVDDSGVLKLLTTGEIELLYRKLPPDVLQNHLMYDSALVQDIVELLNLPIHNNTDVFSTAFQNLFIVMVYKREVGADYFDEALKLSIRGLVLQLINKE